MQSDDELRAVDPLADTLISLEQTRQDDCLILIPSESICPRAVRDAVGSVFSNIYAEGYPSLAMEAEEERGLSDLDFQMAHYRRYNDRRYYQGCQYADMIEALARRRLAEVFARDGSDGGPVVPPEEILSNVQPLSGAAANNAVYEALLLPGDTIMGLELSHGGHLTHGSPLNRSGKYFNAIPYGVDSRTGRIDYDALAQAARDAGARMIVAGASAYPWDIDWAALRRAADGVPGGAYLLADISHPAGLVAAGIFSNPIGYADVVTLTTHKTMLGPRGAVIMTTDEALAAKIDRAVFPGEQGGPHVNAIAGMAVCFGHARTQAFRDLQRRIVGNAKALAAGLEKRGLKLVYGGTETHLLLVDLKAVQTPNAVPPMGEIASRLLELCGLVCNKNTIPGDKDSSVASGVRFGTVWLTQRGMGPAEMDQVADLIHRVITQIHAFVYQGTLGVLSRGKIALAAMEQIRAEVRDLARRFTPPERRRDIESPAGNAVQVRGERAALFLQGVCTNDLLGMSLNETRETLFADPDGSTLARGFVTRVSPDPLGRDRYVVRLTEGSLDRVLLWLNALADGYVLFDEEIRKKIEGPVVVELVSTSPLKPTPSAAEADALVARRKPYFIGQQALRTNWQDAPQRVFEWTPQESEPRKSCLYEEHVKRTSKTNIVPFAGWLMPVLFTSIAEEHRAVRETAGLFDVTHMGVFEIAGPGACRLLDITTTEYVPWIKPGQGKYGYILDPDGHAIDDIFLFCRAREKYMLVANAANAEHVKAWLDAVNSGQYVIDRERPDVVPDARAVVRDLKDRSAGSDMRVDLALQGPASLAILREVIEDDALYRRVAKLHRSDLVEGTVKGMPVLVSKTGYTGQETGYELYVHPDDAPTWWQLLIEKGAPHGLKLSGLGARDSARTEAGLPLYGHELAGPNDITATEAGYAPFVKLHKPFFIGRAPYMRRLASSTRHIIRFQMTQPRIPVVRPGNPVVDARGAYVGVVTSCAVVDGVQTGMAYVEKRIAEPGTPLAIFILPPAGRALPPEKAKDSLGSGDKVLLPYPAEVVTRFMESA